MSDFPALQAAVKADPVAVAEFHAMRAALATLEGEVARLGQSMTVEIKVAEGRVRQVVADRHCQVLVRESVPAPEEAQGSGEAQERLERLHLFEVGRDPTCTETLTEAVRGGRLDGITLLIVD
jgi:hypothetical protein